MKAGNALRAAAMGLVLAHGAAIASPNPNPNLSSSTDANDAAMAKLTECMKLKPATPEQTTCLKAVDSLRKAPTKTKAAAAAPTPAPAPTKAKVAGAPGEKPGKVVEVPPEIKAAAAELQLNGAPKGAKSAGPAGPSAPAIGSIGASIDLKGMDLEAAMMAVQSQRARLLEDQLKGQIAGIHAQNDEIAKLNTLGADLKKLRPAGTDREKWVNLGANAAEGKKFYARLQVAGVTMPTGADQVNEPGTGIYDAKVKTIDKWVEEIKGKIDSFNASQQMDMLRMQSLTNKRNEAFELMTNFLKKMADSRSSVLGNMR